MGNLAAIELLKKIFETTNGDPGLAPAGSNPAHDASGIAGGTPEVDSPAPPAEDFPMVPVNYASSLGSSPGPPLPFSLSPTGFAPSGTAPQGGAVRGRRPNGG